MSVLRFAIVNDWAVLLPIVACSIACLAVTIERLWFFLSNRTSTVTFVHELQGNLEKGGLAHAKAQIDRRHGILGEVADEGIRILDEHPSQFQAMYDVVVSLAARELDRNLAVLGTIATISPYLGLFGTVVRILLTFGELAKTETGGNVSAVMAGIGSALIATAFGLAIAITAVTINNYFRTRVERYMADFEILRLVLLSASGAPVETPVRPQAIPSVGRPTRPLGRGIS